MDEYTKIRSSNQNVLIIGDIMIDNYIYGEVKEFSKEANVPIINTLNTKFLLGGAANVANNLKKLNIETTICSITGDDYFGNELINLLNEEKITNVIFKIKNRKTTIKNRVFVKNKQFIRWDVEQQDNISLDHEKELLKYIEENITKFTSIIISDYRKGVITDLLFQSIIKIANENNVNCVIDSKTTNIDNLNNCTLFKPNREEFEKITKSKINLNDKESFKKNIITLANNINSLYLLITLDNDGFVFYDKNSDDFNFIETTTDKFDSKYNIDTCGAGDTNVSIITLLIKLNDFKNNKKRYLYFLEKCCDIIVHKAGTSFLDLKDIIKIQQNKNNVITKNNLEYFVSYLNETNITTIFTNGCFDILHRGHIEFLKNCKNKADLFILGLNSDESVRLNKGDKRPIIPLEDRIYNLNALKIIDFIIIYDEKTPELLLSELKPTILAKGDKDYTTDNILGKEHAMQTIVISTERYFDTTQIINTILKNYEK